MNITKDTVIAERDRIDGDERLVVGEMVVALAFTNAAAKCLVPREWQDLSDYLYGLIGREPLASSAAFAAHRIVLGALASELRGFAAAAGMGPETSDEIVETYDRHVDDVILTHHARQQEHATVQPSPPSIETDDAYALL